MSLPHQFYDLAEEYVDFEFSHYCYKELGRCISESRNDVLHFREGIKEQYEFPNSAITVNLAPADRIKQGTGFDLAKLLSILKCTVISGAETDGRERQPYSVYYFAVFD